MATDVATDPIPVVTQVLVHLRSGPTLPFHPKIRISLWVAVPLLLHPTVTMSGVPLPSTSPVAMAKPCEPVAPVPGVVQLYRAFFVNVPPAHDQIPNWALLIPLVL